MDTTDQELAPRGLSKEDLEAPPSDNEIRARIHTDVRMTWVPEAELGKGMKGCPVIQWEEGKPLCGAEQPATPMKVFTLRDDPPDRQFPVRETALFCPSESVYWYHYEGGVDRRDVWLGPRKIKLRQPIGVPEEH